MINVKLFLQIKLFIIIVELDTKQEGHIYQTKQYKSFTERSSVTLEGYKTGPIKIFNI